MEDSATAGVGVLATGAGAGVEAEGARDGVDTSACLEGLLFGPFPSVRLSSSVANGLVQSVCGGLYK